MLPRDSINLAHLPSPVTNKHVITNIYMMQISVETCKYEPVSLLIERGQYYCNLVTIVDSIDYSNILPSIHIDKISRVIQNVTFIKEYIHNIHLPIMPNFTTRHVINQVKSVFQI